MKRYLADLIGDEYKKWGTGKILISAPTGTGKTSFILNSVLPYSQDHGKKVLILCNRKLLRQQYWHSLLEKYTSFDEMESAVIMSTYQELAERLKGGIEPERLFDGVDVVCLDEVHYFYSDADFNGFGTYILFYALMIAGVGRQMIFISATSDCVHDWIKPALAVANRYLKTKYPAGSAAFGNRYDEQRRDRKVYISKPENLELKEYNFDYLADFGYLQCKLVPDWQTVCDIVGRSGGKAVVFVDSKELAEKMSKYFLEKTEIKRRDIAILNSENIDAAVNNMTVEKLVINNKLFPRILLTTAVLDNGVSINDEDVENVVILTESKVSFLQMLGRIRSENVKEKLTLYFVKKEMRHYVEREKRGEHIKEKLKEFEELLEDGQEERIILDVWNGREEDAQKLLVFLPQNLDFFDDVYSGGIGRKRGHQMLRVNEFARAKLLEEYWVEAKFHSLSQKNEKAATLEQMSWIGKNEEELEVVESTYVTEKRKQFLLDLMEIQDFTKGELMQAKEKLSVNYRKDFFEDLVSKSGSFSDEKFDVILKRLGLRLNKEKGSDGNLRYSVSKVQGNGGEIHVNG